MFSALVKWPQRPNNNSNKTQTCWWMCQGPSLWTKVLMDKLSYSAAKGKARGQLLSRSQIEGSYWGEAKLLKFLKELGRGLARFCRGDAKWEGGFPFHLSSQHSSLLCLSLPSPSKFSTWLNYQASPKKHQSLCGSIPATAVQSNMHQQGLIVENTHKIIFPVLLLSASCWKRGQGLWKSHPWGIKAVFFSVST